MQVVHHYSFNAENGDFNRGSESFHAEYLRKLTKRVVDLAWLKWHGFAIHCSSHTGPSQNQPKKMEKMANHPADFYIRF